jgi:hypothetical protein
MSINLDLSTAFGLSQTHFRSLWSTGRHSAPASCLRLGMGSLANHTILGFMTVSALKPTGDGAFWQAGAFIHATAFCILIRDLSCATFCESSRLNAHWKMTSVVRCRRGQSGVMVSRKARVLLSREAFNATADLLPNVTHCLY